MAVAVVKQSYIPIVGTITDCHRHIYPFSSLLYLRGKGRAPKRLLLLHHHDMNSNINERLMDWV